MQLDQANYERKQLLNNLLAKERVLADPVSEVIQAPVQSNKNLPWPVMRQRLEEADRLKALELNKEKQIRADLDKKNAELEREVLGEEING